MIQYKRELLILGHPRSGTGYMSALYKANGLDVGHEVLGLHGTSNWQFAVRAERYPFDVDGVRRQDVTFKEIIHIIREPLAAINSTAFTEGGSEIFRSQYIPLWGNEFERAIMSYYGWNRIITAQRPTKVMAMERACELLKFQRNMPPANTRQHANISEAEMQYRVNAKVWEYYIAMRELHKSLLK